MSENGKVIRKVPGDHHSFVILDNTIGEREHRLEIQIDNIQYNVGFGLTLLGPLKTKTFSGTGQ